MAKTSAQRAADLRARRAGTERQVSAWLPVEAYEKLKGEAERFCLSIGEAIERLIDNVDVSAEQRKRIAELEGEVKKLKGDVRLWTDIAMSDGPKTVDKSVCNKIRLCLHPDRRKAVTDAELSEAFRLFEGLGLNGDSPKGRR